MVQDRRNRFGLESILLLMPVLFVQFVAGQPVVLFSSIALCFYLILGIRFVNISIRSIVLLLMWTLPITLMVNPYNLALSSSRLDIGVDIIWLYYGSLMIYIGAIRINPNIDNIRRCFVWIVIIGGLVTIIMNIMGVTGNAMMRDPFAGSRWMGGFDGPNEMGAFYALSALYATGLMGQKIVRMSTVVLILSVSTFLVVNTWSRGAFVGLAMAMAAVVYTAYSRGRGWKKIVVATVAAAVVGLVAYMLFSMFMDDYLQVRRNRSDRAYLMEAALSMFFDKPFFGWGLGGFYIHGGVVNATPHSDYLYFMVSGGVMGLIVLVGLMASVMWMSYRKRAVPELIFLVGFAIQEQAFNNLIRGRIGVMFWFIVVLVLWMPDKPRRL